MAAVNEKAFITIETFENDPLENLIQNGSISASAIGIDSSSSCKKRPAAFQLTRENSSELVEQTEAKLSPEQALLEKTIMSTTDHIYVTGAAGSGKSFFLKSLLKKMHEKFRYNECVVTGTTGNAASSVGGCTLHSFAGTGIVNANANFEFLVKKLTKEARIRINTVKVLFIEEISMLTTTYWRALDYVFRQVRKTPRVPFGGVRLIMFGDFLQLPPIGDDSNIFEDEVFLEMNIKAVCLPRCFRQADDQVFCAALECVRNMEISPSLISYLNRSCEKNRTMVPVAMTDCNLVPESYTNILALRSEVETMNARFLLENKGVKCKFIGRHSGDHDLCENLKKDCVVSNELTLGVGCPVILMKNLDARRGFCNGAQGVIVRFSTPDESHKSYFTESERRFLHQLDSGEEKWRSFQVVPRAKNYYHENYHGYRRRGQNNSCTTNPACGGSSGGAIIVDDDDDDEKPMETILPNSFPVVRFTFKRPDNGKPVYVDRMIIPAYFDIENGHKAAVFCQIPLILGYAITIHRAQGLTLKNVRLNPASIFGAHQLYVVLSRCTSAEGLRLMREIDPSHLLFRGRSYLMQRDVEDHCKDLWKRALHENLCEFAPEDLYCMSNNALNLHQLSDSTVKLILKGLLADPNCYGIVSCRGAKDTYRLQC